MSLMCRALSSYAKGRQKKQASNVRLHMAPKQFRKKPVVIEAIELTRENGAEVWEWADSKPFYAANGEVDGLSIYTLEGRMKADFGDWIVKGVANEFYPVKPEIFEATYEPVE